MSKHKYVDRICIVATVLSLVLAVFFLCKSVRGIEEYEKEIGYESMLFDNSKVHTIDIVMEDWDSFIDSCQSEEYKLCELTIDGEVYKNVGIRGKGNTSLSNVAAINSDRYSFKVEFDQYDDTSNYYGLDKLSLNNIIQDNTYMKDYLVYQMMKEFGVDTPLCSYVYITVNGEDWGLYLAVEGVEEAFLQRNYGNNYGELYKPDSMNFDKGMSFGSSDVKLLYTDNDPDSYSNIFDNAKTDITEADKERLIRSLEILSTGENIESVVDVDEVLRYFVVHNFVCNGDSYTGTMVHNYYLYEKNGQLSMIPWDYNLAFGTFQGANATEEVNTPIDTPVSMGNNSDRPMLNWIFSNEKYTELYYQYFKEFLESNDFEELIDTTYEMIARYVQKDPTKFCTYEEFEKGVKTIKEFCLLRKESVVGQLEGTLPSTSEEQKKEDIMLVDASHILLSDMGGMNNGMGGKPGNMEMPEGMDFENMEMPEGMDFENMEMPEGMDFPERGQGRFEMQEMQGEAPTDYFSNTNLSNWILLAISMVILIIGLLIAYKFKGKN